MTHTHEQIEAMDAAQLRLAIAEAKDETVVRLCDHDYESGSIREYEGFRDRNLLKYYSAEREKEKVATGEVFEWPCFVDRNGDQIDYIPVPNWPGDIACAWSLVEDMRASGYPVDILAIPDDAEDASERMGAYEIKVYD
jgi:hypothetical protein